MNVRRLLILPVVIAAIAACSAPTASKQAPAQQNSLPALFYTKNGSLYVSDPAGTPGRKLTDGAADTEPAPSPDGTRVAYVHRAGREDYGGELWVLDLAADGTPAGSARRLVDPADLEPKFGEEPGRVVSPRWSPTGDRIAFLKAGEGGGFLLVADPATGAVTAPAKPMFAKNDYAWAPDGAHIAWAGGRSDVSPVAVSVLTVGGASTAIAEDTNAFAVAYGQGGTTVVFTNGDATGALFDGIPFALRDGGIYSVPAAGSAAPTPLWRGRGSYHDIAVLGDGALAFTEWSADAQTKSVEILPAGRSAAQTPETIATTPGDAPAPAWTPGGVVAYLDQSRQLTLMNRDDRTVRRIDDGADAFAWSVPKQPK